MSSNSPTIALATDDIGVLISMAKVLLRISLVAISLIVVVVSGYFISRLYEAINPATLSNAVRNGEFNGDATDPLWPCATTIVYFMMATVGIPYLLKKDGAIMAFCYIMTWAWVFATLFAAGVALAIAAANHTYDKIARLQPGGTPTSTPSTRDCYDLQKR